MDFLIKALLGFALGAGVTATVTKSYGEEPSYKIIAHIGERVSPYAPGGQVALYSTKEACEAHRATPSFEESVNGLKVLVLMHTQDEALAESITTECVVVNTPDAGSTRGPLRAPPAANR